MAVWALAQLLPPDAFAGLAATNQPAETDSEVREEWRAGLASGPRLGEDCNR
jgi:hypothetical protein